MYKILKGVAICSVIILSSVLWLNSAKASTNSEETKVSDNNTFVVNGEVLTEDEYWSKI